MIKWLFLNEWRSRIRSSFWQKSLGINILIGLLAAYLALNMLALGFFLDVILRENFPGQSVLTTFNTYFVFYLLVDLLMRFFLQDFPILDLQPYLLLPVRKRNLFHFLLLKSIPTFFNFLPLFFLIPFAIKVVFAGQPLPVALTWSALMLTLVLINNYVAFFLKRNFSVRPVLSLLALAGLAGLVYLDYLNILPISQLFGNFVQAILQQPVLLVVPLAVLAGVYYFLFRVFGRFAYLDAFAERRPRAEEGQNFTLLDRFGRIGQLIRLDLNLIRRNKRPRTQIFMCIIFFFYPFLFRGEMMQQMGWMIFVGVIVVGMAMATYGQFMLSWESNFFDLLMARNFSMREYYNAKFFLFLGFNLLFFLASTLYGLLDWKLPIIFFAVMLFNSGVNSFITMFFSTYNTRRLDPDKQAFFNYQGVGASQFLYTVPLFLLPILIYLPFGALGKPFWGIAFIGFLGVAGMLLKDPLVDLITRQFRARKYVIASGFKQN